MFENAHLQAHLCFETHPRFGSLHRAHRVKTVKDFAVGTALGDVFRRAEHSGASGEGAPTVSKPSLLVPLSVLATREPFQTREQRSDR